MSWVEIDFIGKSKKRPEGCYQTFEPLEENLRDAAHRLLPIMSNLFHKFQRNESRVVFERVAVAKDFQALTDCLDDIVRS